MLALAAIVPVSLAGSASAVTTGIQAGDPVWVGPQTGYSGTAMHSVYAAVPADPANPGPADYYAYCVEHDISSRANVNAATGDFSSYLGANHFTDPAIQAKVYWVLTHSYPAVSLSDLAADAGLASLSANDAIEATQYAIWRYTDLTFDAAWAFETPDSEAVYWHLLDGANADTAQTPPASTQVEVSVTAPAAPGEAGTLYGPFTVSTNQTSGRVSASPSAVITDAAGTPVDANAVVDGQQLYLDLRSTTTAGAATLTVSVDGASGTGVVISTPVEGSTTATAASHAQSLVLVAAEAATTAASAQGAWAAAAVPAIGTTLTDAADEDHVLAWNGGSLIDTIAYTGLTVGQQYTVSGELMVKADASATGITGVTTFTPTAADGTVEVSFTVPTGYAGQSLVAFETLYSGGEATGTPVAEHRDIDDVDQTVAVEAQPLVPAIGTTLLDGADQDHTLAWGGGTVIDTIAYTGLTPGVEYTIAGELMRKSDGSATGITATATFTPTASTGSIAVSFTVPTGYAGSTLVAFETLYLGATASGTPVAAHTDIEDAAQTVVVEKQPAAPAGPSTGSNGSTGSTGGLAATGGALPVVLTAAGVVAILLGTIALIRQRRTRDQV